MSISGNNLISRAGTVANLFADQELSKALNERSGFEETPQSFFELVRLRVKFLMASTWGGQLYRNALLVLSIVSCLFFIIQTYYEYEDHLSYRGRTVTYLLNYAELLLAGIFSFDWLLELFVAEHKTEYIFR